MDRAEFLEGRREREPRRIGVVTLGEGLGALLALLLVDVVVGAAAAAAATAAAAASLSLYACVML